MAQRILGTGAHLPKRLVIFAKEYMFEEYIIYPQPSSNKEPLFTILARGKLYSDPFVIF